MSNFLLKTTFALATSVAAAAVMMPLGALADDDLSARFSWKLKGEYALYYLGLKEGLYEAEGLNVSFGEGAGSQAALGALIQGQEDIVILPGIFAISAIQKGMPVRIIALYQPAAPIVLISHPENPVLAPKDLEGKSIAHAVGETGTSYLGVFCELNDINCDAINKILMDSGVRVPQFLQNSVDVVSVYSTNDLPILEERTGTKFPTLDLAEYGLTVPGMAIVASNEGIENNADALRRFLAATDEAIAQTKSDPTAAVAAMRDVWEVSLPDSVIAEQIEATSRSIVTPSGEPTGWIREETIAYSLKLLATQEDLGETKPLSTFYTNDLLAQ